MLFFFMLSFFMLSSYPFSHVVISYAVVSCFIFCYHPPLPPFFYPENGTHPKSKQDFMAVIFAFGDFPVNADERAQSKKDDNFLHVQNTCL